MIYSYGIIAHTSIRNTCMILLIQRRDTYAFIDFMLGRSVNIENMCYDETQRLLKYNFNEVFKDFMLDRRYSKFQYNKSKIFYETHINEVRDFKDVVYTEQPWGFPKGRPLKNEKYIDTAKREFYEEVRLNVNNISSDSIEERYVGDDDKEYGACYYTSYFDSPVKIDYMKIKGIRTTVSNEVLNAEWLPIEEAMKRLDTKGQLTLKTFMNNTTK